MIHLILGHVLVSGKVLVGAAIQATWVGFSPARQMNLSANPSRSQEENKAHLQKLISQLALF